MKTLSLIVIFTLFVTACQKETIMPVKVSTPFNDVNQAVQMMIYEPNWNWKNDVDTVFFARNELDQIIKRTFDQRFSHYNYDNCERLIKEIVFEEKSPLDTVFVKELSYDNEGRLSKILFLSYEGDSPYIIPKTENIIEYPSENKVIQTEYSVKNGFLRTKEMVFEEGNLVNLKSFYGGGSIEYEYINTYTDIPSPATSYWTWTDFHFTSKNMLKTQKFIDYSGLIDLACISESFEYTLNENGNPESKISGCETVRFVYEQ